MKELSYYRLISLFSVVIFGNGFIVTQTDSSSKGTVFSIIIAGAVSVLTFTAIMLPFLKYPYITVGEYIRIKLGSGFSRVLNALFMLFIAFSALLTYLFFIRYLCAVSLNITPSYFIAAVIAIGLFTSAKCGLKSTSGFTAYIFPVILILIMTAFIGSMMKINVENVFPVIFDGDTVLTAMKIYFFTMSDIFFIVFSVGKEENGKKIYKSVIVSIVIYLISSVAIRYAPIALFGEKMTVFKYPVYQAITNLDSFSLIFKNGFIFTIITFLTVTVKLIFLLTSAARINENIFGKKNKRISLIYYFLPLVSVTVAASVILNNGIEISDLLMKIYGILSLTSTAAVFAVNIASKNRTV